MFPSSAGVVECGAAEVRVPLVHVEGLRRCVSERERGGGGQWEGVGEGDRVRKKVAEDVRGGVLSQFIFYYYCYY